MVVCDNPEVTKMYEDDFIHDKNLIMNPGTYKLTTLRNNTVLNFAEMICMEKPATLNPRKCSIDYNCEDE